jgi:hypothetical protein
MDTNSKKNGVHDLADDELDDLVLELLSEKAYGDDPACHVDGISDDEMP